MLIKVSALDQSDRIDRFLAGKAGLTRSRLRNLIEQNLVTVNGAPVKAGYKVKPGDSIDISAPEEEAETLVAEDIPIEVLYHDGHIAVVNKPSGMVVHPAAGHMRGTLMNALRFRFKDLAAVGGPLRPGVVHRLDKDTSGVLVVALSDKAYYYLIGQFKQRAVKRGYLALVFGNPKGDTGEINSGIGRSAADRKKMSTRTRRPKEARTTWKVISRLGPATLLGVRLATGRTHQIRVHMASIGHPVLGDRTYGNKTEVRAGGRSIVFPRQMLHAEVLSLTHPSSGRTMEFRAPLPEDMASAIGELEGLAWKSRTKK